MSTEKCVRCGQPVEPGRRKYCGVACRDTTQRAAQKIRGPRGVAKRSYRIYDYRPPQAPP
jgi:hypothetical protein